MQKFKIYIDTIQTLGPFNTIHWPEEWRKKVWKLGEQFKLLNPHKFLLVCDEKLSLPTTINHEVIEFIRLEITYNFLTDYEVKKRIETLITKYPLNPEFRHTLGHFYSNETEKLQAIKEYKLALKIEPTNNTFLQTRFNKEYSYLNKLISDGEYIAAKQFIQTLFDEKFYIEADIIYHNALCTFQTRIDDHLIFQNKLKELEKDFRAKMQNELDSERKRIIEVLGFFSAVVAFILSTVSIGKNFSFIEASYFIVALGIILILFVVALSTLFSSNKTALFDDKKFWILIAGLILLFLFVTSTNSISTLLERLND